MIVPDETKSLKSSGGAELKRALRAAIVTSG